MLLKLMLLGALAIKDIQSEGPQVKPQYIQGHCFQTQ
jgi:hypothetical protein